MNLSLAGSRADALPAERFASRSTLTYAVAVDRSDRLILSRIEQGLPTRFYYEPAHYLRELEAIWYANWIYLCRAVAHGVSTVRRMVLLK